MKKIIGLIPARYASSRLPAKPLCLISGKSMIQRVYEQALKSELLSEVIVATDDIRIHDHVLGFGGNCMMTSPEHKNGTERCIAAYQALEKQGRKSDFIINIQGDEPFLQPDQLNLLCNSMLVQEASVYTLITKITNNDELLNPNVVKVVRNHAGKALYFSRSAIPYGRDLLQSEWIKNYDFYKHIGLYGFNTSILNELITLNISSLENAEKLEQLRWLENGFDIHTAITEMDSISVDTPEDLEKAINFAVLHHI